MGLLGDGVPRGVREISVELGLSVRGVESVCYRGWRDGLFLRSAKEVFGRLKQFHGRAGVSSNVRGYYLYLLRVEGQDSARRAYRQSSSTSPIIVHDSWRAEQ